LLASGQHAGRDLALHHDGLQHRKPDALRASRRIIAMSSTSATICGRSASA